MIKNMKKEAKKTTVKVTKKEVISTPEVLKPLCRVCNGIGLARPTFVNSPICETCKGSGYALFI